jgi:hypothetical protein
MPSWNNPNHAPVAKGFFLVSASVSSSASAIAAGVGPFRGLYFNATSSVTIVGQNGNSLRLDAVQPNAFIWIEGAFCSAISSVSASSVFGLM